jgi:hypothetical protein
MEFHPIANIFPLIQGEEYQKLVEDIGKIGLLESIWLYEGKILDGRNRYLACLFTEIEPKFKQWNGEGGSPINFVLSMNLNRRHLDSSQRAACAVAALPYLEEEAKKRQGQRTDLLQNSQNISQKIDGSNGKATEQAAEVFSTNHQYVSDAKKLAQQEPELFERVRAGEITIPKAKQEIIQRRVSQQVQVTIFSSETNEYYTPLEYLEAAHEVMGGIDLDPATCEKAQENVKAKEFFTMADDGLSQEWHGSVWLNPPYGKDGADSNQGIWAQKLITEYKAGHVSEAILLTKAALGYNWFTDIWHHWPVCFADKRLSFIKSDGSTDGQSKQGTAFFYFGPNVEKFKQVFKKFGPVIMLGGNYEFTL